MWCSGVFVAYSFPSMKTPKQVWSGRVLCLNRLIFCSLGQYKDNKAICSQCWAMYFLTLYSSDFRFSNTVKAGCLPSWGCVSGGVGGWCRHGGWNSLNFKSAAPRLARCRLFESLRLLILYFFFLWVSEFIRIVSNIQDISQSNRPTVLWTEWRRLIQGSFPLCRGVRRTRAYSCQSVALVPSV